MKRPVGIRGCLSWKRVIGLRLITWTRKVANEQPAGILRLGYPLFWDSPLKVVQRRLSPFLQEGTAESCGLVLTPEAETC